jgi:hypothetical protein
MSPRIYLFSLVVFLVVITPSIFLGDEKAEQQAVRSFKQYISDLMTRYKADNHQRIERPVRCQVRGKPHGYVKGTHEPGADYTFDVRKTDSLVTPYIGILELRWRDHYSECQETREKAEAQSELPDGNLLKYRYTYGFQDGKWIPQGREIGSFTAEGNEFRWESCSKEQAYLEADGFEADFGCLVPY